MKTFQQIKQYSCVALYTEFAGIPGIRRKPATEVFHLEPVLHIDCKQDVAHGR